MFDRRGQGLLCGYNAAGLKQIADDLSDKGKGSAYYAEMEDNLTKGTQGSLTLSDGSNLPFRLIGILHDDKADGSGKKAGLTFMHGTRYRKRTA